MSGLIVLLTVMASCGGCFALGVTLGCTWRIFDRIEERLLDKIESLRGVGDDQ